MVSDIAFCYLLFVLLLTIFFSVVKLELTGVMTCGLLPCELEAKAVEKSDQFVDFSSEAEFQI